LHTGGIFAALSDSAAQVAETAMRAAKRHGTVVSYDLNFRPSLWEAYGGTAQAQRVNGRLVPYVDVVIGNEEDFTQALGFELPAPADPVDSLDPDAFRFMMAEVARSLPNLSVVATTLRGVRSAGVNDWGAVTWAEGEFHVAEQRPALEVYDRVGGGDSFAAGLVFALLEGFPLSRAVEYGAAHGALAMTTPGDTSMATVNEVERLVRGGNARVQR
jgi:2-dehydro-3-deoxygluconokinase